MVDRVGGVRDTEPVAWDHDSLLVLRFLGGHVVVQLYGVAMRVGRRSGFDVLVAIRGVVGQRASLRSLGAVVSTNLKGSCPSDSGYSVRRIRISESYDGEFPTVSAFIFSKNLIPSLFIVVNSSSSSASTLTFL